MEKTEMEHKVTTLKGELNKQKSKREGSKGGVQEEEEIKKKIKVLTDSYLFSFVTY
jgi:hypothetical protein